MNDRNPLPWQRTRFQRARSQRRAAAAVEFAVAMPVVVMMLMGALELGRSVMANHSVDEAARAACRVYSVGDTSQQDVDNIISKCMSSAGISNYTVTYDPATKGEVDTNMEPVSVTISVPYSQVAWVSGKHMNGATIVGSCTLPADIDQSSTATSTAYSTSDDDNTSDGHSRYNDDNNYYSHYGYWGWWHH